MLNLLMSPRTARTVRGLFGTVADAVRSIVTPAALVEARQLEDVTAPDPANVYDTDELPAVEDVESAAAEFAAAADQARTADRAKRKSRKILDRLPAGLYGGWLISRTPSSRQTADLDAIRATYERLGLGPVPMKRSAPSLKVEAVEPSLSVAA